MFDQLTPSERSELSGRLLAAVVKCGKVAHYVVARNELWQPVYDVMRDANDAIQELGAVSS